MTEDTSEKQSTDTQPTGGDVKPGTQVSLMPMPASQPSGLEKQGRLPSKRPLGETVPSSWREMGVGKRATPLESGGADRPRDQEVIEGRLQTADGLNPKGQKCV